MKNREDILSHLYYILDKNTHDIRIYYRLADKTKRSFLKNFFRRLSHQKRVFCRRIRFEIKELENEHSLIDKREKTIPIKPDTGTIHGLPSFKTDIKDLIVYSYKREQEYLRVYKDLLSNTHLGNIREMLLNQKHAVQMTINDLKTIEKKFNFEKNQGEINYF